MFSPNVRENSPGAIAPYVGIDGNKSVLTPSKTDLILICRWLPDNEPLVSNNGELLSRWVCDQRRQPTLFLGNSITKEKSRVYLASLPQQKPTVNNVHSAGRCRRPIHLRIETGSP